MVPQFGYGAAGTDERALEDIYKAYNGERRVVGVKSREVRGESLRHIYFQNHDAAHTEELSVQEEHVQLHYQTWFDSFEVLYYSHGTEMFAFACYRWC